MLMLKVLKPNDPYLKSPDHCRQVDDDGQEAQESAQAEEPLIRSEEPSLLCSVHLI